MTVVKEQNFPAAPWVTLKLNAWKAFKTTPFFHCSPSCLRRFVPDTTSALLGTRKIGKVTVEHSENEQTVKGGSLCAFFCMIWLNLSVNVVMFVHRTEGTQAGLHCSVLPQFSLPVPWASCVCSMQGRRHGRGGCLCLKSKTPAFS